MAKLLKRGQSCSVTGTPRDAQGNASQVQDPSILSTDEAIAGVDPIVVNPDGSITSRIRWAGPGTAQVQLKGDADLGDGVKEITGIAEVTCLPDEAVTFDLQLGEAEEGV